MTTENLNDFWDKSSDIPMETFDQNGDIITFETCVLNKWETDFENLYRTVTIAHLIHIFKTKRYHINNNLKKIWTMGTL